MLKLRSSLLASGLVLAAAVVGCKKEPDQALVIFDVTVAGEISFTDIEFSVMGHDEIPRRQYRKGQAKDDTSFRLATTCRA
jgi:hypothetical protein